MKTDVKKRLDNFLDNVVSGIKDENKALEVRLELEDHIRTKAEIKMISGISEEEALTEVLDAMGNEMQLHEQFENIHRVVYKKACVVSESERGICYRLAESVADNFKIPVYVLNQIPDLDDEEMLIIVTKFTYINSYGEECLKYLKKLELKNIRNVLIIGITFSARHAAVSRTNLLMQVASRPGEDSLIVKILREKDENLAIEDLLVCRDMFRLGNIGKWEMTRVMAELERQLVKGGNNKW